MLAAFLKAIGCIIPLMDAMYASYYTREVMLVLVREFQTPDEEMKKIVLKARGRRQTWRPSLLPHCCAPFCGAFVRLWLPWMHVEGSICLKSRWSCKVAFWMLLLFVQCPAFPYVLHILH